MATIYENVAYLSQEIGPRPAGTEEEQKAALYITEQIQAESGLPAIIEDFQCSPDFEIPKTICCIVVILTMLLSIFAPVLNLILVVLAGIAAALFAAEAFDMPVLSRFFVRGMSQNVVARYEPGYTDDKKQGRKRKVIFIARYDSGKISRETTSPLFHLQPLIRWIELFGIVANFVVLLLRAIINPMGVALIVFNILSIITMAICALPIIGMIFHQISSYNEGANCNASGVAVLMELAARIGKARVPATELPSASISATIHGAEAAEREGLLPEGAEVVYDVEETPAPEAAPGSAEERLLAAKAAVAALSGRPVSQKLNISFDHEDETAVAASEAMVETVVGEGEVAPAGELAVGATEEVVAERVDAAATVDEAAVETIGEVETVSRADAAAMAAAAAAVDSAGSTQVLSAGLASRSRRIQPLKYPAPQPTTRSQSESGAVPDWFSRAQKNAKRTAEKPSQAQRSRYAQAYDNAQATMAALREAEGPEISETERKLQAIRDSLSAPTHPQSSTMTIGEAEALNAEVEPIEAAINAEAAASQAATAAETIEVETAGAGAESAATVETIEAPRAAAVEAEVIEAEPVVAKASPSKTGGLDSLFGAPEQHQRETVHSSVEATPIMDQTRAFVPVKVDLDELRSLDVKTIEAKAEKPEAAEKPAVVEVETVQSSAKAEPSRSGAVEVVAERATETTEATSASTSQLDAMRAAIPSIKIDGTGAEAAVVEENKSRLSQELPSIAMSDVAGDEGFKQRAPLAETPQTPTGRMRQLQASLPHLGVTGTDLLAEEESQNDAQRDALRSAVPSLSGVLNEQAQARETIENISVSQASSFAASSATGAFEPIGDELVEDIDPEERYVDDVDDSAYAETMTETGAFSGPGYVEMPEESRVKRLFGRFRRDKRNRRDEEPESAQEWLDVDEEFDARTVGAARGGWESFRDDDFDDDIEEDVVEEDLDVDEDVEARRPRSDRRSARKSVSRSQSRRSPHPRERSSRTQRRSSDSRRWHGGAFSGEEREKIGRVSTASEDTAQETVNTLEEATTGKSGEIFRFRHPEIDVEVWFVALGAELANNAGMNAFLADHRSELRGATIIELEGIGAGELAVVEREGMYLSRESSSRIERMIRKAGSAVGAHIDKANMEWRSSATSYALRHGSQAIQLIGALDGKPAYFGEESDVVESIDEEMLERDADLLMELLKDV